MEVNEGKIIFTQQEVVHILWTHNHISTPSHDNDKADFVNEINENYSRVRQSDTKDSNVVIDNIPPSRELLARRIIRHDRQKNIVAEPHTSSTQEQVESMHKLHQTGRTAKSKMARRIIQKFIRDNQQE